MAGMGTSAGPALVPVVVGRRVETGWAVGWKPWRGGGSAHNARPASGCPVPPALPWNAGSTMYRFLIGNPHTSPVTTAFTLRDNANNPSQVRHAFYTSQTTPHTSQEEAHPPKSIHTILDAEYEYDAHSTSMALPSCTMR